MEKKQVTRNDHLLKMPKQVLVVWSIFLEFSFFFFHDCSIVRILGILALLLSHLWKFSIVLKRRVNRYEWCYEILSFFNGYWFCPTSNFQFRPFKCIMKSKSLNDNINIQDWKPFLSWDFSNPLFIF